MKQIIQHASSKIDMAQAAMVCVVVCMLILLEVAARAEVFRDDDRAMSDASQRKK